MCVVALPAVPCVGLTEGGIRTHFPPQPVFFTVPVCWGDREGHLSHHSSWPALWSHTWPCQTRLPVASLEDRPMACEEVV